MSFEADSDASIEIGTDELKERGPDGQRVIQPKLTIWNSAAVNVVDMVSGRWEGCKEYPLAWEQLLELHASMTRQIEFLKPLIETNKIVAK